MLTNTASESWGEGEMSLLPSLTRCDIKEEAVRPNFRIIYSPFHFQKKVYTPLNSIRLSFTIWSLFASRDIFSLFLFGHLVPIAPAQLNHLNIKITIATIIFNNNSIATFFHSASSVPSTVLGALHILVPLISTCILYFNSHCIDE